MTEKCHVYMTGNGRISMAGLVRSKAFLRDYGSTLTFFTLSQNENNVDYVAECIDKVVRGSV